MPELLKHIAPTMRTVAGACAEALWPTRCAVCDAPGAVLCDECEASLDYLDLWRACPRCGAAFGRVQCTECSPTHLAHLGREDWPFDACASACVFDDAAGRIVRAFKDQGEQRLAAEIARIMARTLPADWPRCTLAYVPASAAAWRRRGFDHAELIARHLASELDCDATALFERPESRDQRALSRDQRIRNLQGRFKLRAGVQAPARVLLIDDVFTTGATLSDATDTLVAAGTEQVFCLTFARVM